MKNAGHIPHNPLKKKKKSNPCFDLFHYGLNQSCSSELSEIIYMKFVGQQIVGQNLHTFRQETILIHADKRKKKFNELIAF